jgi:hypothetical protein
MLRGRPTGAGPGSPVHLTSSSTASDEVARVEATPRHQQPTVRRARTTPTFTAALAGRAGLRDVGRAIPETSRRATTGPLVGRACEGRVPGASRAAHERPCGRAAPGRRDGTWQARCAVRRRSCRQTPRRGLRDGAPRQAAAKQQGRCHPSPPADTTWHVVQAQTAREVTADQS